VDKNTLRYVCNRAVVTCSGEIGRDAGPDVRKCEAYAPQTTALKCASFIARPCVSRQLHRRPMRSTFVRLILHRPLKSLIPRKFSSVPDSKHNLEVDVCIVGGGIVGSCVAAALKRAARTCDCPAPVLFSSPLHRHRLILAQATSARCSCR